MTPVPLRPATAELRMLANDWARAGARLVSHENADFGHRACAHGMRRGAGRRHIAFGLSRGQRRVAFGLSRG
jgi:hypothetical protein